MLEIRLRTLVLPVWMQLADEKAATRLQDARRFREYERQVLDVFQYQVAYDQLSNSRPARPGPGQVCRDKADVRGSHFPAGLREHPGREIQRADLFRELCQQKRVFARAAADFHHGCVT